MKNEIKTHEFKADLAIEFEIIDLAKVYQVHQEILTEPHRAAFYHILWFEQSTTNHLVNFTPMQLPADSILFLNKNIVHHFDTKADIKGIGILFTDRFFCQSTTDTHYLNHNILFNDLLDIAHIQPAQTSADFYAVIQLMRQELQHSSMEINTTILKNLLHNFLLASERIRKTQHFRPIQQSIDLEYVMQFKTLLECHFQQEQQVSFYANKLNITTKRLNIATAKVVGKTPKNIITERVLLTAKQLLIHTQQSVKEIAFALGFQETTNFIKYFRKYTTLTPLAFKESYK